MLYAMTKENKRIPAAPESEACCPFCNGEMTPKCGEIKIWHWAHKSDPCDLQKEQESDWHLAWKSRFPEEWAEIRTVKGDSFRVSDIFTDYGLTIEFQRSAISFDDIMAREAFHQYMLWVFDSSEAYQAGRIKRVGFDELEWSRPKRNWVYANRPKLLDFGGGMLFRVTDTKKTLDADDVSIYRIWGHDVSGPDFIDKAIYGPEYMCVTCPYKGYPRRVHFHVCKWHRRENDPECERCEQWKSPLWHETVIPAKPWPV